MKLLGTIAALCFALLDRRTLAFSQNNVSGNPAAPPVIETDKPTSCWKEVRIATGIFSSTCKEESKDLFQTGESVLLISDVASDTECEAIVCAARKLAEKYHEKRQMANHSVQAMCRLPTLGAAERAASTKTPCADSLDAETDQLCQCLLRRAVQMTDKEFPSLVHDLFGGPIAPLFEADNLTFSSREPAVNLYTKGGQFLAHEDGQKLTVLIPLSSSERFTGGGTAFWAPDSRGHRVEPPSTVLRPPAGTMVLFAGHVPHAGLPLDDGERVVFVASFSRKPRSQIS